MGNNRKRRRRADGRKPHTKYSPEFREKCIAHTLMSGSYAATSRKYDVPSTTLQRWVKQVSEGTDGVAEMRLAVRRRTIESAWRCGQRLLHYLERQLEKVENGDETALDCTQPELTQMIERVARSLDNLGAVVHKHEVQHSTPQKRRREAEELEQFEETRGLIGAGEEVNSAQ